jgi:hypothetical protein
MWKRIIYTGQAPGMPSEWIRKDRITGHVRIMGRFINRKGNWEKARLRN